MNNGTTGLQTTRLRTTDHRTKGQGEGAEGGTGEDFGEWVKPEIGLELPLFPWRLLVQFTAEKAKGGTGEKLKS